MSEPVFLYLHGFASSPMSNKARAFQGWATLRGLSLVALDLRVPSLEKLLFSAIMERVIAEIDAHGGPRSRVALIGSSLGGLAACRVAEVDPRVFAVFAMAPAFRLARRWEARFGREAWAREVDDYATGTKRFVHYRFVEELMELDASLGELPDVRVPTRIVHGLRDEVVDIESSREWARGKPLIRLREVDDAHELTASVPLILDEADDFFGLPPKLARRAP